VKLELTQVRKYFHHELVLDCPRFQLNGGEVLLISGANGAGKTTLLRILGGALSPDEGSIISTGIQTRALYEPRFFQFDDLTVQEHIHFLRSLGWDEAFLSEYMQLFGLERFYQHRVGELSKGWRARLGLAITFGRKADLVLLDEPLDGLDVEGRDLFSESLLRHRRYCKEGLICVVSHEQDPFTSLAPTPLQLSGPFLSRSEHEGRSVL
jgi:ABC-type multidrug transport system ATPase subunit